jgi:hypothetical protein
MAAENVINTVCNLAQPPGTCPPSPPEVPCPPAAAAITTDIFQVLLPFVDTLIDFMVDVFESNPPVLDADAANDLILVGESNVYNVTIDLTYGIAADVTATARIRVDTIIVAEFDVVLSGVSTTHQVESRNIQLSAGNELTVSVEGASFEGAVVKGSLAAVKVCGPPTGPVIVPQG